MSDQDQPTKKKLKIKSEGLWLMSFADLSFILMCFFALLLSFSTLDKQKFENVRDGMLAKSPIEIKSKKTVKKKKNNLKTITEQLQKEIKKQHIDATVKFDSDGVTVEFKDKLFFASGSANINPRYRHVTNKLLNVIANSPKRYELILEGHTDDVPLGARAKYRSNWELSSARGLSLLKDLKGRGVSENRMSVVAYAHTRPKIPIKGLSGEALAKARAANRRVVIKIK